MKLWLDKNWFKLALILTVPATASVLVYGFVIYPQQIKSNEQKKAELDTTKKLDNVTATSTSNENQINSNLEFIDISQQETTGLGNAPKAEKKSTTLDKPLINSFPSNETINKPTTTSLRLLTATDRAFYTNEAKKIISFSDEKIRLLDKTVAGFAKSKYREEYAEAELAIFETKKIYESDKKMANAIIKASVNASENDYVALNNAYDIFVGSAIETINNAPFMTQSISNIISLSNDVVESRIELDVIDDLSAQYGISSYTEDNQNASQKTIEATKKADDYIKSLIKKYDDEQKVKNYLIGIIIVY